MALNSAHAGKGVLIYSGEWWDNVLLSYLIIDLSQIKNIFIFFKPNLGLF